MADRGRRPDRHQGQGCSASPVMEDDTQDVGLRGLQKSVYPSRLHISDAESMGIGEWVALSGPHRWTRPPDPRPTGLTSLDSRCRSPLRTLLQVSRRVHHIILDLGHRSEGTPLRSSQRRQSRLCRFPIKDHLSRGSLPPFEVSEKPRLARCDSMLRKQRISRDVRVHRGENEPQDRCKIPH